MLESMQIFIRQHQLWQPGDRLVLGISAGVDSMVLMSLLVELAKGTALELVAAHVHHGVRQAADQEAEFLDAFCREVGIPYYLYRIGPDEIQGASWEEQARKIRYRFFTEIQNQTQAQMIVTAHHRDDVAETVLLHLMRGSGLKGIRGILPKSGCLSRPLLFANKEDIYRYAQENDIRYYEDLSNQDLHFTRNRIRHQLLPLMEKSFNPQVVSALNDLAEIVRAEDEAVENLITEKWKGLLLTEREGEIELDAGQVLALPLAFQRRIILQTLQRVAGISGWSMPEVERIRALLGKSGSHKRLHLKKRLIVCKVYDKIIFSLDKRLGNHPVFQILLPVPATVEIAGLGIKYKLTVLPADTTRVSSAWYFDYDALTWPLLLRSRQPGDYIRPLRRSGKKIKKILMEYHVPESERNALPILCSQSGQIYGILELGIIDAAVVVTKNTQRVLEVLRLDKK